MKTMNEVLEDIHFLGGHLQRVNTRYVEVVDSNITDVTEHATSVKDCVTLMKFRGISGMSSSFS